MEMFAALEDGKTRSVGSVNSTQLRTLHTNACSPTDNASNGSGTSTDTAVIVYFFTNRHMNFAYESCAHSYVVSLSSQLIIRLEFEQMRAPPHLLLPL